LFDGVGARLVTCGGPSLQDLREVRPNFLPFHAIGTLVDGVSISL
jgi:hypothetical protein